MNAIGKRIAAQAYKQAEYDLRITVSSLFRKASLAQVVLIIRFKVKCGDIIEQLYENHLIENGKSGYGLKRYDAVEKSQCEHIAPNTENQDANSGYCPYDDEFRESYLNCLGNYLLLSGHHNESIGNTTFEAKRNTYTQLLQQQEIRNITELDHLWDKAKLTKEKSLLLIL